MAAHQGTYGCGAGSALADPTRTGRPTGALARPRRALRGSAFRL